MNSLECLFPTSTNSYTIDIQEDFCGLGKFVRSISRKCAIIADETVAELYACSLKQLVSEESGLETFIFSFPCGEEHKSAQSKESIENTMFSKGLGKDTVVIALGGGITTDLAGHVAATYCRGVPLVILPTSLLAMVDASIGGKNGINTPHGKNLVGSIYQPKKVLINISLLKTLPKKELRNGIVEMIKHGLIADSQYFSYLEDNVNEILHLDPIMLKKAIFESCRIKKEIVEQDEHECSKRRILNFGHTLGHAIETVSHYEVSHGEAVALGMLIESHIAMQLGYLDKQSIDRISHLLKCYGVSLTFPHMSYQNISQAMILDKKSLNDRPRFIILKEIGTCAALNLAYCTHVEEKLIQNAYRRLIT